MSDKYSQNLFDRAKQYATDPPKTSKRIIQKTAEAIGGSMVIKLLIELQKFQKIRNKIFQTWLQMSMIKKCLKKDMYLQK